jgi:apolipoprotein N-acyltransferase
MSRFETLAKRIAALAGLPRLGVLFLAGALAGLAMPPIGLWPGLFLAFPVLIWTLDGLRQAPARQALAAGWSFGLGYFASVLYWIGFAFLVDAETYLWMMPFMVGGLAALMACYWGLAALAARLLWRRGPARVGILAATMGAAEWLRGHLFTGFPWAAPGLAAEGMGPVLQLAAIVGMTGLAFLMVLWAGTPVLLADHGARRSHRVIGGLVAALLPLAWGWGYLQLAAAPAAAVPGVQLRIVQPNIPQSDKWRAENGLIIFEKLLIMSRRGEDRLSGATHIIWPESAVPFLIDESEEARAAIDALLPEGAALITGSLRRQQMAAGDMQIFNSIIGFDELANAAVRYDKWRLVPGGEFLPLEWLLEPLGFRKVVTVPGSFTPGPGPVTLPVPGAPPAGFLVCYEVIFPDRLTGGERPGWLINVTNDGWFGNSSGPYQHLAQVRMRAVEQGLPVVRAANTGISAVIDPYGRVLHSLRLGTAGIIDSVLPAAREATLYARFGDLWLLALAIAGLLPAIRRNVQSQERTIESGRTTSNL